MSTDGQGTLWRRNIAENLNRLSRVHQRYRQTTDRRQTDGRPMTYSEHELEFTFAKNGTQKQKFPIWKGRLSSSYAVTVTVCAQSGRHLHKYLHVSCADRIRSLLLPDFLSADPVASICRRSRSSAEHDQSLSGNFSNNFLAL